MRFRLAKLAEDAPAAADAGRLLRRAFRGRYPGREISVAFVGDARMRALNRRFLGRDRPTDVLAFPLEDGRGAAGEVVVSTDTARREAEAREGDVTGELLLYCVHGVLHLLGYDDHDPEARRAMRAKEAELLARVGYGHVSAER